MSYTKLFNSIISSTIWTEDDQTRIVWITMLAMADKNGEVQGSIPGLARMAGVTVEATEKALSKFLSPDPYSRTKDEEGRRIEEIEGGWAMINHAKYRLMASKEDQKEKNAERQRRFKKRKGNAKVTGGNAKVTPDNDPVTQERDIAEAEAEAEAKTNSSVSADADEKGILLDLWNNSPKWSRQRSSKKMVYEAWKKIKKSERPNRDELVKSIKAWSNCEEWTRDGGQYAQGLHLWIKAQRWESNPDPVETAKIFDQRRQQAQEARPF